MPPQLTRSSLTLPLSALLLLGAIAGIILSRDLLQLYVAWEVAGLAVWLALLNGRQTTMEGPSRFTFHVSRFPLLLSLHSPGWILLALILLGLARPLVPPAGGAAQPWPLAVTVAFGTVVLMRSACWPFNAWARQAARSSEDGGALLLGLYHLAAPILLAKALVAAPWNATGTWVLALMGTVALLDFGFWILDFGLPGPSHIQNPKSKIQNRVVQNPKSKIQNEVVQNQIGLVSAHAAAAIIGFALAPGSPLAAMGAVALMLSGALWLFTARHGWLSIAGGWSTLLGGSLGAWAIAQAALGLRYGVIAALLLPAWLWLALRGRRTRSLRSGPADDRRQTTDSPSRFTFHVSRFTSLIVSIILFASAIFPQATLEWVLRPVVGAMAGGVGALSGVETQWGVGLLVRSGEETLVAALPATGMALAVGLAWVALYWLSRIASRFAPVGQGQNVGPPDAPEQ